MTGRRDGPLPPEEGAVGGVGVAGEESAAGGRVGRPAGLGGSDALSIKTDRDLIERMSSAGERALEFAFAAPCLAHMEAHQHLRTALSYLRRPGKALRPFLVYTAAEAAGGSPVDPTPLAAALEVFHVFTLVHDDFIDQDDLRRGHPTAHALYRRQGEEELGLGEEDAGHFGASLAVLGGDLLLGCSIWLAAQLRSKTPDGHELGAMVSARLAGPLLFDLTRGQVEDLVLSRVGLDQVTPRAVLGVVERKTAALIRFACAVGAMSGVPTADEGHPHVRSLSRFGEHLGVAFQLVDDLLGLYGDTERLGKPVGSDLREGKRTLLLLETLGRATPSQKALIEGALHRADLDRRTLDEVRAIAEETGARRMVRELAGEHADESLAALDQLPETGARELLSRLPSRVLERNR